LAVEDVLKTAIEIALSPLPNLPLPATLSNEEKQLLNQNRDRIKQKLLKDYEKTLITKHQLKFQRYTNIRVGAKRFIFLQTTAGQSTSLNSDQVQYWYRAMDEDEFLKLKRANQFVANESYGGIANCRDYSAKYVTNTGTASIIVEWHIPPAGRLVQLMTEEGIQYKSENGGFSYGLGEAGTNAGKGADAAFRIFDKYCGLTFKVVDLRIPIRVDQLVPQAF
jgi:hypothetical protein